MAFLNNLITIEGVTSEMGRGIGILFEKTRSWPVRGNTAVCVMKD